MRYSLRAGKLRHFPTSPKRCQLIQHIPTHGVDGCRRKHQSRFYRSRNTCAQIRRTAGLAQTLAQSLLVQHLQSCRLRNRTGDCTTATFRIRNGDTAAACGNRCLKHHRHQTVFCGFIALSGFPKPLLILGYILPDTKHSLTGIAGIVAICKSLAVKGSVQRVHHRTGHIPLIDGLSVNTGHSRHIFRTLHATLQLQRGNAHLLQRLQVRDQTIIF